MRSRPPFVDAHVHLWELDRLRYDWLSPPFGEEGPNGSTEAIARTYRLGDYLADLEGWAVEGLVHVEAGAAPEHALEETRWLQGVADAAPFPMALVAFVALDDPQVERRLTEQAAFAAVRGVRHILNWHPEPSRTYTPRNLLDGEALAHGYGLLARYGLSFDLQLYPHQMADAARLAARHPDVPVILNHAGMPADADPDGMRLWREGLAALAALPHVSIKLSGFGLVRRPWSVPAIAPLIDMAIDAFGPSRCLFASDAPTDKLFSSLRDVMNAYDRLTAGFSEDERTAMFGANARRIYRLN